MCTFLCARRAEQKRRNRIASLSVKRDRDGTESKSMKRKEEKREKREIKKRGKKEEKKSRKERKKEREREREKEKERVRVEKKREAYVFCIQLRPVRRAVETRGRIVSAATVVSLAAAFRLAMTFFRDAAPRCHEDNTFPRIFAGKGGQRIDRNSRDSWPIAVNCC